MVLRPVDERQRRRIGALLEEPLVVLGHPLTCNGGNPDWNTHHDHEVLMMLDDRGLVCPECGRVQEIPEGA